MATRDYAAIALGYARGVVDQVIPTSIYTQLACQRTLDDIEASKYPDYPYEWSAEKVTHVCGFMERLPLVKGMKGQPLLRLEPWQVWWISQLFGWVERHGPRKGMRRFSMGHIEVARGNGKSALCSGLLLYMTAFDGEAGAECYAVATDERQAEIVFRDAMAMGQHRKASKLMKGKRVSFTANNIIHQASYSKATALSGDPRTKDGLNIHFAVVDELHAHPTRDMWDVIVTGAAKRDQSMILAITTAGFDLSGVCYEQRDYLIKC
ncbi:terminase large subunit domain-containing protein [Siccirubricoccus soli]|uniref:terminase large subunit domain-containing protein n=1 Tax=Siccirubricoccus soli TaxID=2899147 RepID=UPI0035153291